MQTLPADLLKLIVVFSPAFANPTWESAKILLLGALLACGKRTVTACLRVVGLSQEEHFQNYHRVLNRAKWNTLLTVKILFGLLLILVPSPGEIVLAADDTIERRRGKKIKQLGCYRDPVRSSQNHVIKCFGLKWVSMALLVRVPWAKRPQALPFLTVLCRAHQEGQPPKVCRLRIRRKARQSKMRKTRARTVVKKNYVATGSMPRLHKTAIDQAITMIRLVARWCPDRVKVLAVDGGYAAVKLALVCAGLEHTKLVMRFHWDAALHDFPGERRKGSRGPTPLKGKRLRSPKQWAARKDTKWDEHLVEWYGGERRKMKTFTRTALWYTPGYPPVAIRYVITRDPEGKLRDEVFACTDLDATVEQILAWFVMRWSLEVTFEEAREHLGMETQRQWSDLAIVRTTPIILGLFSLVVLLVHELQPDGKIPIRTAAWYEKSEATFSDCLAFVRKHLWESFFHVRSARKADFVSLPAEDWQHVLSCLSATA
jgi:hypothetical protein